MSGPDEEQVRVLAYEIYQTRHAKGTSGDAVTDWLDAERMLREKPAATRPRRSASRS